MFITLEDNFYPLELTIKEQILNYHSLLDRSIRSWKTRGRLRMRTERKIANKQVTRKLNRLHVWHSKQTKFSYQMNGFLYIVRNFFFSSLFFLEFLYNINTFFLFFRRSCFLRRLKKRTFNFLKT